jgi:iron(III) transport system substrate-binding protein
MKPMGSLVRVAALVVAALSFGALPGCSGEEADVVVYVALDRNHSEPIIEDFEAETGLKVEAYYDSEANKSIGLRRRLQEESDRPICDVWWNNEVVQTVLLAREGLLQPYVSPGAEGVPGHLKDPGALWTGFAARARVLIVNTDLRPDATERAWSTRDFLDPANADRCGMARPLTGTTAAHAGVWIAATGLDDTLGLLKRMRDNKVHFGPGNAHLMRLVRAGELDFGWTDTDDYQVAADGGFPVAMLIPDQGPDDPGLIVIPNTVALVKDAPHADAGKRLIDYLLSASVEERLARGPSAQIPVHADVPRPDHVLDLTSLKVAEVDWQAAGTAYQQNADTLEAFFTN